MTKKKSGKKTLQDKVNDLDPYFVEEVYAGNPEQLRKRIIELDRYEQELAKAKEDDMDLLSKREALKVANQTYSVPLSGIKLKRAFLLEILDQKGN